MGLQEWIESFRGLHARARQGQLQGRDLDGYHAAREELAAALLAAQRLQLRPGETARGTLRVPRALQVDLEVDGSRLRAMTLDVSMAGFSAMLGRAPESPAPLEATLRLPSSLDPLACKVKAQAVKRQGGSWRVSFLFDGIADAERERVGFVVFDTALEQLKR